MKKYFLIATIALTAVFICFAISAPDVLPSNDFLEKFLGPDILNIMAVIMTIAIASIATIHIWFNELENKHGKKVFGHARNEINQDASSLIGFFILETVVLFLRSFFQNCNVFLTLFDGAALMLLLFSVFCLMDIMEVIKSLTPKD